MSSESHVAEGPLAFPQEFRIDIKNHATKQKATSVFEEAQFFMVDTVALGSPVKACDKLTTLGKLLNTKWKNQKPKINSGLSSFPNHNEAEDFC